MKNKGIWIVILLILITGMISTSYTRNYVKEQGQAVVTAAEAGPEATPVAEIAADSRMMAEPEMYMEVIPETATEPQMNDSAAKMEVLVQAEAVAVPPDPSSLLTRLEELDAQIAKNHAADQENSKNYSVKARAESELKLWEAELESIITTLNDRLDSDKQEELAKKQREWYRQRETKAIEASGKKNTSSLAELEYTFSLVSATRERAYELANEYEQVPES